MKQKNDFQAGKEKREGEIEYLHRFLPENVRFEPIIFQGKPFGIHFRLQGPASSIAVIFAYQGHGGVYLKVPQSFMDNPDLYVMYLANLKYHMLIVGVESTENDRKYSYPIDFKSIWSHWSWHMATSKDNKNRLQFTGPLSTIEYLRVNEELPFSVEGNLIDILVRKVS